MRVEEEEIFLSWDNRGLSKKKISRKESEMQRTDVKEEVGCFLEDAMRLVSASSQP